MHYKLLSAWIFALLALMVALLFIFPSPFFIWLSIIGLPVLIGVQTWVVLRAQEESKHEFNDDKWYEDRQEQ